MLCFCKQTASVSVAFLLLVHPLLSDMTFALLLLLLLLLLLKWYGMVSTSTQQAITSGSAPVAPPEYGGNFSSFVASCLVKEVPGRPLYRVNSPNGRTIALVEHPFYVKAKRLGNYQRLP